MNFYRKILYVLFLTFFDNSCSWAAYNVSLENIDVDQIKLDLSSDKVQEYFWQAIKEKFQKDCSKDHQQIEFLCVIEFLFERIRVAEKILFLSEDASNLIKAEMNFFSNVLSFDSVDSVDSSVSSVSSVRNDWEVEVCDIYVKTFKNRELLGDNLIYLIEDSLAKTLLTKEKDRLNKFKVVLRLSYFYASRLLEKMIVSSEIFQTLCDDEKKFWSPVQDLFKDKVLHNIYADGPYDAKIYIVCEVLIYIKNLYKHMDESLQVFFNKGAKDMPKEEEDKLYQCYIEKNYNGDLKSVISKWPKSFGAKHCFMIIDSLVKKFCEKSSYYYFVRYS